MGETEEGEGRELWERERQRGRVEGTVGKGETQGGEGRERDAGKEMRGPVAMTFEFETKCEFSCGRKDSL